MELFKQTISLVFKVIEMFFRGILSLMEGLFGLLEDKKKYKAEFASSWSLLSPWNYGFCLTGNKNLSVKMSYQNALIVGGTGTGKSSVVLCPSVFTMKGSFVIHDPSGEIFSNTSGYLKNKGYEIKQLNFSKPDASCGFNPLQRANTSSEINKISSMLVQNALGGNGHSKDPFWTNSAISLLTLLISILKKQDIQFQNLYNVRLLLNAIGGSPEKVDRLFSKHADENLFSEYKSFLSADDKVISGTVSTCKAALNIFSDEAVAKVTSTDNIDMQEFRSKIMVLYIQNSVAEQKYYSTLTSIFFEQFFSHILSRFPKEGEQDIFFLIDECSSLSLPTLPLAVANVRKHRSGIMLIVQDFAQLIHNYGRHEAESIKTNCFAKMYFTGQSLETSTELENILGKYEYKDSEGKKIIRELMTKFEVRQMKLNEAILICGHHKPIKATLRPYYKSFKLNSYSKIPVPQIISENYFQSLPALSLSAKSNE